MGIETGTALAIMAGVTAVSGLASAGASIYASSQQKKSDDTAMPQKDRMASEAARQEAELMRKRKGARSTILTSPLGVEGSATTQKSTLGD
jgi:hypothetical protein